MIGRAFCSLCEEPLVAGGVGGLHALCWLAASRAARLGEGEAAARAATLAAFEEKRAARRAERRAE